MQQHIILHDLFLHGTQYFQIVIRICNDNRCLQTIALVLSISQIKA